MRRRDLLKGIFGGAVAAAAGATGLTKAAAAAEAIKADDFTKVGFKIEGDKVNCFVDGKELPPVTCTKSNAAAVEIDWIGINHSPTKLKAEDINDLVADTLNDLSTKRWTEITNDYESLAKFYKKQKLDAPPPAHPEPNPADYDFHDPDLSRHPNFRNTKWAKKTHSFLEGQYGQRVVYDRANYERLVSK